MSESILHLRELGCDEDQFMWDTVTQQSVTTSTEQFWGQGRRFLLSIRDVVCNGKGSAACPNDDFMPHVREFVKWFNRGLANGSWDIFLATSYDRRWICESVNTLKNCIDVNDVVKPCRPIMNSLTVPFPT